VSWLPKCSRACGFHQVRHDCVTVQCIQLLTKAHSSTATTDTSDAQGVAPRCCVICGKKRCVRKSMQALRQPRRSALRSWLRWQLQCMTREAWPSGCPSMATTR
jgi:hypothetical protein